MEWLKEIRKQKGMTLAEVAQEAGISESYYCQIEGKKRGVTVKTAKRIAAAIGFDWQRFYDETVVETKNPA